jgi:FG-GAP-like repeat
MIGKHAPTVPVLNMLLLAVASVVTHTEVSTRAHASTSAMRAAQSANLPLFLPAVGYDPGGSGEAGDFRTVAVADMNGDEMCDVAVTNFWTGTVGVLLGNGDGTFRPAVTYNPGGANPSAIALADVSGDGHADLVVGIWSGGVGVLLGDGAGTFQPAVTYASGGVQVSDVTVADVNLDGKSDVIVANFGSVVATLLGNGDGTFRPPIVQSASVSPFSVAVADVNGDGKPDVVAAGGFSGGVGVLLGNGDGSFGAGATYNWGAAWAQSVAMADLNGDKHVDIAVANCGSAGCDRGIAAVLLGNGDGTFAAPLEYDSGAQGANGIVIADVNGDQRQDLLVANWLSNAAGVLLGRGDGTFEAAQSYGSGGLYPMSIAAADVNGDAAPDLVLGNECDSGSCDAGRVGVLLNNTADTTPPVITVSAVPKVLWPPNGKMVPVTVSGTIVDTGTGVNVGSVRYRVKDEYGSVQPHGRPSLGAGGGYSFTVFLQSSRLGADRDGRHYSIVIAAMDNAGNRGRKAAVVTVPHHRQH